MKILLATLLLTTLAGCANYQIGDTSKSIFELRERYCEEVNPITKHLLKNAINKRLEGYPEGGLCTDADTLLERTSHYTSP